MLEVLIERLDGVLRWRPFHRLLLPASSRVLRDPLQHDDRDDSLGPLRVVLERREVVAVRSIQAVALGPPRDRGRPHPELLATHLDLSLTMLHPGVIPTGMRPPAAPRGRDHIT